MVRLSSQRVDCIGQDSVAPPLKDTSVKLNHFDDDDFLIKDVMAILNFNRNRNFSIQKPIISTGTQNGHCILI